MTFKEFKKHYHDRAIKEYGFKKDGNTVVYNNDEVLIVFDIVKSSYSNSLSRFALGINPVELNEEWGLVEPMTFDGSHMGVTITGKNSINLDEIDDFNKYDEIFDDFFKNKFPKWLSIASIKEMILSGEIYVLDYLKDFWNLKPNTK